MAARSAPVEAADARKAAAGGASTGGEHGKPRAAGRASATAATAVATGAPPPSDLDIRRER
jgi:hypothetical protein